MSKAEKQASSSLQSSMDSLFEDTNRADEDLLSVDGGDEDYDSISSTKSVKLVERNSCNSQEESEFTFREEKSSVSKTFSNNNIYIPVEQSGERKEGSGENKLDVDIEKEFEDYLNEDNSLDGENECRNLNENENLDLKCLKLKRLENLEYSVDNYEAFRQMGIEKYGFINKKYRRKVWPLLIMYKNVSNENINSFVKNSSPNTSKIISKLMKHELAKIFVTFS